MTTLQVADTIVGALCEKFDLYLKQDFQVIKTQDYVGKSIYKVALPLDAFNRESSIAAVTPPKGGIRDPNYDVRNERF